MEVIGAIILLWFLFGTPATSEPKSDLCFYKEYNPENAGVEAELPLGVSKSYENGKVVVKNNGSESVLIDSSTFRVHTGYSFGFKHCDDLK